MRCKLNNIIEHKKCRLCGSECIQNVFDLGEQFVNDFVPRSKINTGIKAPLVLVYCHNCTLVQLKHTAPQELLYTRHYWYRSGVTETMRRALAEVATVASTITDLKEDDVVLDIGANDGTLLASYNFNGLTKVGCEPANNLVPLLKKITPNVIHDFWSLEAYNNAAIQWQNRKPKIITALGMFYDLDDPNQFISDIAKCLEKNGVFIAQLMCLQSMLDKNDLGNICHEHIEYYSYKSLVYMFEKNGLEIFKVEENNVNGGSYRIFARHLNFGSIDYHETCGVDDIKKFEMRINENKNKCVAFIQSAVSNGKTVYVYGASTKGNVILQYYGLDNTLISGAAERSPEKWGKYTIGTGIPIVSEVDARNAQPDYFLVLPWAFFDEFYKREVEWIRNGGKFILPLSEFRVVP